MKLARWGHALAVRLPAALIEELGLKEGDEITLVPGRHGTLGFAFAQRHERAVEWMRTPDSGISTDLLQSYFSSRLTTPDPSQTPPTAE